MKIWLEQGFGVWGIGALTGLCVLLRLCLYVYYARLSKACGRFWQSSHKALVYIKEDLNQRETENQRIKNSMIYTECRLAECKAAGVRLGTLECIVQQSLLVVPLCGIMTAFAGVLTGCGNRVVFSVLFVSGAAVVLFLLLDLCVGIREKHRRIRLSIRDSIENGWEMRETEAETGGEIRSKRKKKEKKAERRKEKESRMKCRKRQSTTGKRKNGKAQEEKRRLTEELLRERRQLEARSFAELRKRDQKEETELQRVCAEAAVTEQPAMQEIPEVVTEQPVMQVLSQPETGDGKEVTPELTYEELLSEVLAEYLA